jgi:hypothetical protein
VKHLITKIGFAACLGAILAGTGMISVTMYEAASSASSRLFMGAGVIIVSVSSLCLAAIAGKMDD